MVSSFLLSLSILLGLTNGINGQLVTYCQPEGKDWNATMIPCCGWPKQINSRVTISRSPGPGGAPSPCATVSNVCVNPCRLEPSPMVFESNVRFIMDYLKRFRWDVYCPRWNWFYDSKTRYGESPCYAFKLMNSGIDVTLYAPESPIPICTSTPNYQELGVFQVMNANNCSSIQSENYLVTKRRIAYGMNLVTGCGQLRTVVLSKAIDEFPVGYSYRLVRNPLRNECITDGTSPKRTRIIDRIFRN